MAPHYDPVLDHLISRYALSGKKPEHLYQGSRTEIITKLRTWLVHRKDTFKKQMEMREISLTRAKYLFDSPNAFRDAHAMFKDMAESARRTDFVEDLDATSNEDIIRANFLLESLKNCGVTWPEFWWHPEADGGVCSFLSTVDPGFDAFMILTTLEDKEHEERLLARRAVIAERYRILDTQHNKPTSTRANQNADGHEENQHSTPEGLSKTQARREARKKAKAKAKAKASQENDAGKSAPPSVNTSQQTGNSPAPEATLRDFFARTLKPGPQEGHRGVFWGNDRLLGTGGRSVKGDEKIDNCLAEKFVEKFVEQYRTMLAPHQSNRLVLDVNTGEPISGYP